MQIIKAKQKDKNMEFKKIILKKYKHNVCPVCGGYVHKGKTFWQTVNPYNKKNGVVKTEDEIRIELEEEAQAWGNIKSAHDKCKEIYKTPAHVLEYISCEKNLCR